MKENKIIFSFKSNWIYRRNPVWDLLCIIVNRVVPLLLIQWFHLKVSILYNSLTNCIIWGKFCRNSYTRTICIVVLSFKLSFVELQAWNSLDKTLTRTSQMCAVCDPERRSHDSPWSYDIFISYFSLSTDFDNSKKSCGYKGYRNWMGKLLDHRPIWKVACNIADMIFKYVVCKPITFTRI